MEDDSLILVGREVAPSLLVQYFAAFCVSFSNVALGAAVGFTSPAGPQLTNSSSNSSLIITDKQSDWLSSSIGLGALIGAPLAGVFANYTGRKGTLLLIVFPAAVGWALIGFANTFRMLITGRIVTGICCGITSPITQLFIAEFSSADIRGRLGTLRQICTGFGILYAMFFGSLFGWRWLAFACLILLAIQVALLLVIKESPRFLVIKKRMNEASVALQTFRGKDYDVTSELEEISSAYEEYRCERVDMCQGSVTKHLFVVVFLMFFQQATGAVPIIFNLNLIFQETEVKLSYTTCSVVFCAVQMFATGSGGFLMDKFGRRTLLLLSSSTMAVSLYFLGFYFYNKVNYETWTLQYFSWLPLTSMVVFIFSFAVGLGPIPWILLGETFVGKVRDVAGGISAMSCWLFIFVTGFSFIYLKEMFNIYGVFWTYSFTACLTFIFCLILVEETKGRTLEDISLSKGG